MEDAWDTPLPKIKKGKKFDLEDFRDQIQQMNNMGGISDLMDKMPGMGTMKNAVADKVNEKQFVQIEAIINFRKASFQF